MGFQLVEGSVAKDYQKTETRLNIPRLDYSNGTCPSLLVEPQRTNLVTYSSSFDNAIWSKISANGGSTPIVTANYAISPDGTQNADRIQLARTNNYFSYSYVYQAISASIGQSYTWSVWLKSLSGTPSVGLSLDGVTYTNVVTLSNEWERYEFTTTATALSIEATFILFQALPSTSLTADFLAYGFQLEAGSYATSYIPTTSASVTRNADVISKTGIGSIFGTSYTIFGDVVNQNVNNTRLLTLKIPSGGYYDNFITIYQNGTALTATGNNASSVEQFTITSGSYSLNQRLKFALRCENNNVAFYINGTQIGVDTSCTIPQVTALYLGNYVDVFGVSVVNSAAAWPTALTNTQLAQLTTI